MNALIIRECVDGDLPVLVELWQKVGFKIGLSETPVEFHKFLEYNPTTSIVGIQDNTIVCSVLGGYDGRRGLVHHLAVDPQYQKNGYGRLLMDELLKRFQDRGVVKVNLWIEDWNKDVIAFYEHIGWELRDLITMSKILRS